jgi:hypothetical protein
MRILVKVLALAAVVLAFVPSPASAHPMDFSKVRLVLDGSTVHGTTEIALPALQQVLGSDFGAADRDALAAYLREHIAASSDGAAWPLTIGETTTAEHEGMTWLTTEFELEADAAGDFLFEYDAVTEGVSKHEAEVVVTDASGETVVSGVLTQMIPAVTIGEDAETDIGAMVGQGFRHVHQGADHLLFLIMLLIPAPLVAAGHRWARGRTLRGSLWAVVRVAPPHSRSATRSR